ncbi:MULTISPECIES: DUF3530 family protein [unclassified Legionella]|uniref:DUF3530 family protein n=1 Tax=unclassified Legionella TaxID=2622702 RepID=UPI00105595DE|nr:MULTISPECIES: DUF3530 family protein [unclassified Legionella]MDI9819105.1 DUF3530 family protein [Legionella sp. PL877]
MQLFLGFCLLFFLNFAEVKAASLDILVKGQKVALPYWPSKGGKQRGGVVIVNGEQSVAGSKLPEYLGEELAKLGWSVALLSTSQQVIPWTEQLPEVLSTLRQKNNKRMAMIHYGSELSGSVGYFSKLQSKQLNGMILLSAFDLPENEDTADLMKKISFPLLDITGQFDYTPVLEQAAARKQNVENKKYSYQQLSGADHDYLYKEKMLAITIHGWMQKLGSINRAKAPVVLD